MEPSLNKYKMFKHRLTSGKIGRRFGQSWSNWAAGMPKLFLENALPLILKLSFGNFAIFVLCPVQETSLVCRFRAFVHNTRRMLRGHLSTDAIHSEFGADPAWAPKLLPTRFCGANASKQESVVETVRVDEFDIVVVNDIAIILWRRGFTEDGRLAFGGVMAIASKASDATELERSMTSSFRGRQAQARTQQDKTKTWTGEADGRPTYELLVTSY